MILYNNDIVYTSGNNVYLTCKPLDFVKTCVYKSSFAFVSGRKLSNFHSCHLSLNVYVYNLQKSIATPNLYKMK